MTKIVFFVFLSVAVAVLSPFCRANSERMNQPQALSPSRTDREKDALASLLLHVLTQRSIAPVYSSYPHWSNFGGNAQMPSQLKKKDTFYRYRDIDIRAFGSFFTPLPSINRDIDIPAFGSFFTPAPSNNRDIDIPDNRDIDIPAFGSFFTPAPSNNRVIDIPAFGSFFSPAPSDKSDSSKVFRHG